ncbi:hypothetical protein ACPPVW_18135 [Leifsonia sp. McL0607]|uniref:hypothetical protein n=1 Tax=Leifsonia sp. McL0607 TaxID=3415672 RepID=UPI003CE8A357
MRIRGVIQPTKVTELTASADDVQTAREAIEVQVPDGYDLLQVHNTMAPGGAVVATARIRPSEIQELEAEGIGYMAARDALRSRVPEGWRLLHILTVEG